MQTTQEIVKAAAARYISDRTYCNNWSEVAKVQNMRLAAMIFDSWIPLAQYLTDNGYGEGFCVVDLIELNV